MTPEHAELVKSLNVAHDHEAVDLTHSIYSAAADAIEELAAEVDALRSIIAEAVVDLESDHGPEWASEAMRAKGKDPIGCHICFPKDGHWPCLSAMVLDDLRTALEPRL